MANFKPQATFITTESLSAYRNGTKKSSHIINQYSTYKLLKRHLKAMLLASHDEFVSVSRSRRGEWGEWFETWALVDGKPKIIKQGWM